MLLNVESSKKCFPIGNDDAIFYGGKLYVEWLTKYEVFDKKRIAKRVNLYSKLGAIF